MKRIIISIAALCLSVAAFAQQQLDSLIYIFPQFEIGSVMFSDKTFSKGKVNIDILEQKLKCIDQNDTLEVDGNIVTVTIKRRTFYWNKDKFIELLEYQDDKGLGISRMSTFVNNVKDAGYGMTSGTTSTTTYGYNETGHLEMNVVLKYRENLIYKATPFFYVNGKFQTPSKKAFQKAFPAKKDVIESFVAEHDTRWAVYDDVKALYDAVK